MSQMYSSCTVCYKPLAKEDFKINEALENFNFPVCLNCLNETSSEIENIIKK